MGSIDDELRKQTQNKHWFELSNEDTSVSVSISLTKAKENTVRDVEPTTSIDISNQLLLATEIDTWIIPEIKTLEDAKKEKSNIYNQEARRILELADKLDNNKSMNIKEEIKNHADSLKYKLEKIEKKELEILKRKKKEEGFTFSEPDKVSEQEKEGLCLCLREKQSIGQILKHR